MDLQQAYIFLCVIIIVIAIIWVALLCICDEIKGRISSLEQRISILEINNNYKMTIEMTIEERLKELDYLIKDFRRQK